jgi:hypothetical protein
MRSAPIAIRRSGTRALAFTAGMLIAFIALMFGTGWSQSERSGEPIAICVAQPNEGQDPVQQDGMDARHLAKALMDEVSPSGETIRPILVVGLPEKAVASDVERLGCSWVVELIRHDSVDSGGNVWNPPSGLAADAGPVPDVPPIGDRDAIFYSLHRAGSKKSIAHGSAPPATYRGRTGTLIYSPYPLFARQIMKKIGQSSK